MDSIVKMVTSLDGLRRVEIFRRDNGTFGFEDLKFDIDEQCWLPQRHRSTSLTDSPERALAEARERLGWLSSADLANQPEGPEAFNPSARILITALAATHPAWESCAMPYGPEDDREARPGSVRLSLPLPHEPAHRLDVALRGNTIEVAYECGPSCGRAEQQFIVIGEGFTPVVAEVCDFVESLLGGQTVVVRERLGRITRWLRRDGITELARFRSAPAGKRTFER